VLPAAEIVALGHTAGARREALALVDSSWTIDSGRDTQIAAGDMALAGRRVFGKVMEVGAHTCVVRRADQAGYRDVVQLAARAEGTLRFGAKGILEGTGEGHARLRLVNASDAVAPGDLVLTAGQQGLASQALWYGTVARCERRQGAPHWDIWVDLAAERDDPAHLIVLRAELNPARLAASPESPVARH